MTEYKFHSSSAKGAPTPSVRLEADSPLHGAAVALRQFIELGCDIGAPLAHVETLENCGDKSGRTGEPAVEISLGPLGPLPAWRPGAPGRLRS